MALTSQDPIQLFLESYSHAFGFSDQQDQQVELQKKIQRDEIFCILLRKFY